MNNACFRFQLSPGQSNSAGGVRAAVKEIYSGGRGSEFSNIVDGLSLIDLNHALFRCDQEEQTEVVTTIKDFAIEK